MSENSLTGASEYSAYSEDDAQNEDVRDRPTSSDARAMSSKKVINTVTLNP